MRSPPAQADSSPASRSGQARMASASGRSRAATRWVTLTTCASALALAGCGGHHGATGSTIFQRSCAGCHTLTGHNTRTPGGDLAMTALGVADIAGFVRVMPVRLNEEEIDAVAAYVHAVERARRAGHNSLVRPHG